jgi:hypothetical protein
MWAGDSVLLATSLTRQRSLYWTGPRSPACALPLRRFISLGFLANLVGRKAVTMLFYFMCLILTPVVYLWAWDIHMLLFWVSVFGFFTLGICVCANGGINRS